MPRMAVVNSLHMTANEPKFNTEWYIHSLATRAAHNVQCDSA